LLACVVAFAIGLPLGIFMALRANTWIDRVLSGVSLIGISIPTFWLAIVLITVLSVTYGILPVSGRLSSSTTYVPITGFVTLDSLLTANWGLLRDALLHALMPAFALGIVLAGSVARVTRASMIGVLQADYIRFARAKGLSDSRVILVHALKNAMVPVVTITAIEFGSLIGGAVVTETIFGWPGIGRLAIEAVSARNYPLIQGSILVMAILFVVANTVADLICAALNPKIEL
jgi:peptide/nickel transport system permease protein